MTLITRRVGPVEVHKEDILFFPIGILGFPDIRRYVMLDHHTHSPMKWLQAVDKPDLAFPIVPPTEVLADYDVTVAPDDLATLGVETTTELLAFVILTIPSGAPDRTTANLKAPILVNPKTHLARQVLVLEDYPIPYPLSARQPAAVECGAG